MRFFAVAAHFLGIRARNACLNGCKFGRTGFVAPKCATHTKIIVATNGYFLVVTGRVGVVGVVLKDGCPLVAVVRYHPVVAIHHAGQSRIQVQRTLIEL